MNTEPTRQRQMDRETDNVENHAPIGTRSRSATSRVNNKKISLSIENTR